MVNPQTIGVGDVYSRRSEIRDQLSDGNLKPALRRLHDFAADFGTREQQNEVVLLDSRLSHLKRDSRQLGITENTAVERNKINADVLSLIDEIIDASESLQPQLALTADVTPLHSEKAKGQVETEREPTVKHDARQAGPERLKPAEKKGVKTFFCR